MTCVDFGPDASDNQLLEGGKIRCHDARMSDWSKRELVWDSFEKSRGERTHDMSQTEHEILDGMLPLATI